MTTLAERPLVPRKLHKTRKTINVITWVALCVMIAGIGVLGVYIRTGNAQITPILSGSMEPFLMTGDAAIVHKVPVSSLHNRDIIIFIPPNAKPGDAPKIHRIFDVQHIGTNKISFTSKGDNNPIADPWGTVTSSGTAFKVVAVAPYVGWLINIGIRWIVLGILLLLAGVVIR